MTTMRRFALAALACGTFATCTTIATQANFGAVQPPTQKHIDEVLDHDTADTDTDHDTVDAPSDDDEEED